MPAKRMKLSRVVFSLLAGGSCILLTLFAIYGLSQAAVNEGQTSEHYLSLLILAGVGLVVLVSVIIWQIVALWRHIRRRRSGARLTVFFGLSMLTAALLPVTIIAFFSWQFLSYDLGKTFNRQVSATLDDALQLTREAISLRARQALDDTRKLSVLITEMTYGELINNIEAMRRNNDAIALAVFDYQGNIVAFAHRNLDVMTVPSPTPEALIRADQEQEYFEFTSHDDEYSINVLSNINKLGRNPYYLQAVFSMPESFNSLAKSVRDNYQEHQAYTYLQPHITTSLLLILVLILALTLLFTFWLSVLFGEHMTQPLRTLITATRRIADGDYHSRVVGLPNNDLGALGDNFNRMSMALSEAQRINDSTQRLLAEQKAYLEKLMDNITAGVIVLSSDGQIELYNRNAQHILEVDLAQRNAGTSDHPPTDSLDELFLATTEQRLSNKDNWQQQITLSQASTRRVIMCRGTHLHDPDNQTSVSILVFDDVTDLIHNQRNAAWEEVARRLAHEIKNPLTPIRLQSERLQLKLADKLDDEKDLRILHRATDMIINQVDAMKEMVSDFSQFAKPIELRRKHVDINQLLHEIRDLYPEHNLHVDADAQLPQVVADPVKLRQVFINLTKNAFEAAGEDGRAIWYTERHTDHITIIICDNGKGFNDLEHDPFEPYVTSKSKGTGLGLAIVKKIIQEHSGQITIGNSSALGGAKITIILPINTTHE